MNTYEAVETFHLVFLRHFAPTVGPVTVCLKWGVNLRLYHGSPRLSEDMDFDARVVGVEVLRKNVRKVLESRPLRTELAAAGIGLVAATGAKQTSTVQRWKCQLLHEEVALATRLEFSRRGAGEFEECAVEQPSAALLAERKMAPFVLPHFTARAAYRQKVRALAARTQVQARDVFDLHHLSGSAGCASGMEADLASRAISQLGMITFAMFYEQVVPFLPPDLAAFYGTPEAWTTMVERVRRDLARAAETAQS